MGMNGICVPQIGQNLGGVGCKPNVAQSRTSIREKAVRRVFLSVGDKSRSRPGQISVFKQPHHF